MLPIFSFKFHFFENFVAENFCHLPKVSSLFSDKVFRNKVFWASEKDEKHMEKVLKIALIEIFSEQNTQKFSGSWPCTSALPWTCWRAHTRSPCRPPAVFCLSYGQWIGLLPKWFSQMPQKCHLSKIFS